MFMIISKTINNVKNTRNSARFFGWHEVVK